VTPDISQCSRVLGALHNAGAHGITSADFAGDSTVDGGPRILRIPRVIADLRAQGVGIPEPPLDAEHRRDGCVIYRLAEHVVPAVIEELRAEPEPSMWAVPEPSPEPEESFTITFRLCRCGFIVDAPQAKHRCYCRDPHSRTVTLEVLAEAGAVRVVETERRAA